MLRRLALFFPGPSSFRASCLFADSTLVAPHFSKTLTKISLMIQYNFIMLRFAKKLLTQR